MCTCIDAILYIFSSIHVHVHVSALVSCNCYGQLVVTGVESWFREDCYSIVKGLLFYANYTHQEA